MNEYEYKTYGTARFLIEGGMYSIQELEDLLAKLKEAKRRHDNALKDAVSLASDPRGLMMREKK